MLDGVYDTTGEAPVFHPVRAPTAEQLQTLLHQIIKRVMKLLTRLGYLVEEQDMLFLAETDTDAAMAPLQSASWLPVSSIRLGMINGGRLGHPPVVMMKPAEDGNCDDLSSELRHGLRVGGPRYPLGQTLMRLGNIEIGLDICS